MKYCVKCGRQLPDDALFCSSCGTKIVQCEFSIDGMEGHKFEHFCAELLKKNGFSNVSVTPGSGDQGVDVLATKDGIKYAIQCKNYSSTLSNTPIQEVSAGKLYYGAHVGVVMTNSTFSQGAKELARATNVLLWDGTRVKEMMKMLTEEELRKFGASESYTINSFEDDCHNSENAIESDVPIIPIRKGMARLAIACYVWAGICAIIGIAIAGMGIMALGEGVFFLVLGFMFSQLKRSPKGNKYVCIGKLVINKVLFVWICIILAFAAFAVFCSYI